MGFRLFEVWNDDGCGIKNGKVEKMCRKGCL